MAEIEVTCPDCGVPHTYTCEVVATEPKTHGVERQTRGDKVRRKSDEELAEFLAQARAALTPVKMEDKTYGHKDVVKWLRWLREEAET